MLSPERRQKNHEGLGTRLKDARVAAGYTQKALADALGIEYYTMISQMELGYISIPPALWSPIADKLKLDRPSWVLACLRSIQPEVFTAIFGNKSVAEVKATLMKLDKGIQD